MSSGSRKAFTDDEFADSHFETARKSISMGVSKALCSHPMFRFSDLDFPLSTVRFPLHHVPG
jgi:hypothetical protein